MLGHKVNLCWLWWYTPIIPALRRLMHGRIKRSRPAWATKKDSVSKKTELTCLALTPEGNELTRTGR
jgi:hypothetical protein